MGSDQDHQERLYADLAEMDRVRRRGAAHSVSVSTSLDGVELRVPLRPKSARPSRRLTVTDQERGEQATPGEPTMTDRGWVAEYRENHPDITVVARYVDGEIDRG